MKKQTDIIFNGNLPCINHRAAILDNDIDKLKELISISDHLSLSGNEMTLITVFLSQLGYIDKRYTLEELEAIRPDKPCNCNVMRTEYDLNDLCYSCTMSDTYSNKYINDEKLILSYCFINTSNKNFVAALVKNRSKRLFRSFTRVGKNDKTHIYLPINLMIYEYISKLPVVFRSKEKEEYDLLIAEFLKSIQSYEKVELLNEEELGYLISYFLTIHNDSEKVKLTNNEVEELCKKLISEKYKKVETNKNRDSFLIDNQLLISDILSANTQSEKLSENNNQLFTEQSKTIPLVEQVNKEFIPLTDNNVSSETMLIQKDNVPLLNFLSLSALKDYDNFINVISESTINNFDYSVLINDIIAVELIQDGDNDYVVIYLYKQRMYYILNLKNKYSTDILRFYLAENSSIIKVSYSSILLINILSKYGFEINNLYSIETMYYLENQTETTAISYENIINNLTSRTLDSNIPTILQGMKYYHLCFKTLSQKYTDTEWVIIKRETIYEHMIANSYYLDDLLELTQSSPYVYSDTFYNGMKLYSFNYNSIAKIKKHGKLICCQYMNEEVDINSCIDAYKDICIKCITSSVYDKYKPMLLSLSKVNGLIFFADDENYAAFLSILNRWLVKSGKKYLSTEPLINIEVITY